MLSVFPHLPVESPPDSRSIGQAGGSCSIATCAQISTPLNIDGGEVCFYSLILPLTSKTDHQYWGGGYLVQIEPATATNDGVYFTPTPQDRHCTAANLYWPCLQVFKYLKEGITQPSPLFYKAGLIATILSVCVTAVRE